MIRRVFILSLMFLFACSTHQNVQESPCIVPPTVKRAWFNQKGIYRLRHDGVILINGTSIPITGLMNINMDTRTAKTTLLTGLGFPLATVDISATGHTVIQSTPLARKIPLFAEQYAFSIQQTFLRDFAAQKSICTQGLSSYTLTSTHLETNIRTTFDKSGKILRKEYVSPHDTVNIDYETVLPLGEIYLPRKTSLTNTTKRYSIILKLNHAERQ